LRLFNRAFEAYAYITSAQPSGKDAKPAGANYFGEIKEMAQWRVDYLHWITNADRELGSVLKPDWQTAVKPLKFREGPPDERPAVAESSAK
jgi:hypothetical protein